MTLRTNVRNCSVNINRKRTISLIFKTRSAECRLSKAGVGQLILRTKTILWVGALLFYRRTRRCFNSGKAEKSVYTTWEWVCRWVYRGGEGEDFNNKNHTSILRAVNSCIH